MPNDLFVDTIKIAGKDAYRLNERGVVELGKCAKVGMTHQEIADMFGVSRQWIEKQIATNEAVGVHYRFNDASGAREIREALHDGAVKGDPQLLKFVGERRLKMRAEVEHQHVHTMRVIGAQPNYKLTAEDWAQQYAPKDIVDAEYTALPAPDSDGVPENGTADTADGVRGSTGGERGADGGGERRDEGEAGGSDAGGGAGSDAGTDPGGP